MSTTIRQAGQQLVDKLVAGEHGHKATQDPGEAVNNRPCLLVAPPALDWAAGTMTGRQVIRWRIIALSSHQVGSLDVLDELDPLIAHAADTLPVETADPGVYQLQRGMDPVPCYVLNLTT